MAQLQTAFDATQYDPTQTSGGLPVGKHKVIIEKSEIKTTKAGDGGYLQVEMKVVEGPAAGATGANRYNIYNPSQEAKDIAHRQLSALCHCIGVYNIQDTTQLHGIPFIVDVALQGGEGGEKGYTEVKKVFDVNGNEPEKAGQGTAPQQTQQTQAPQQGGQNWGGQAQNTQPPQQNGGQQWGAPAGQQNAPAPTQEAPANQGWQQQGNQQAPAGGAAPAGNGNPPWQQG